MKRFIYTILQRYWHRDVEAFKQDHCFPWVEEREDTGSWGQGAGGKGSLVGWTVGEGLDC